MSRDLGVRRFHAGTYRPTTYLGRLLRDARFDLARSRRHGNTALGRFLAASAADHRLLADAEMLRRAMAAETTRKAA